MSRNSNLTYALAAMAALAFGLGVSFWRSSAENKDLLKANLTAGIALATAQDEAKVLREKLAREIKAREFAEAARLEVEVQLESAALKLAQETEALVKTGVALEASSTDLTQEREVRAAAEQRRDEALETIAELTVKLNEEIAASLAVREALAGAEGQVRLLSTKLAGQMAAGEKAVTMKMAALSPAAGSEALKAADEAKNEAARGASAQPAEVPNRIPASLAKPDCSSGRCAEPRIAAAPSGLAPQNGLHHHALGRRLAAPAQSRPSAWPWRNLPAEQHIRQSPRFRRARHQQIRRAEKIASPYRQDRGL
jgi:hypothetical protein